jgi:hypothetical protein
MRRRDTEGYSPALSKPIYCPVMNSDAEAGISQRRLAYLLVALVNLSTREKMYGSLEARLCLLFPQKF